MKHECKKAWRKIAAKINDKQYKVWAIKGCEKCKELETCNKMEAVFVRAGQAAIGTINKVISKSKGQVNILGILGLVYLVGIVIVLVVMF